MTNSSSSSEDYSDGDLINVAYESDSSAFSDSCQCIGTFCTCDNKSIRVLTNNSKEILFDITNHIEDPELKSKYLFELKNIVIFTPKLKSHVEPFNMKHVMNRFNTHTSTYEPSIQELKTELKSVKDEVKQIKQRVEKIEME